MDVTRLHIVITGLVQGVGFRPHAYHVAQSLKLTGWVQNTPDGVSIEIQGTSAPLFITELTKSLPTLARIDTINSKTISPSPHEPAFTIMKSQSGGAKTMLSPDTAICKGCLEDLFNPQSHYYHYPFLNCTHCGPRLTITRALPYDRDQTSMANFPLCRPCLNDYSDPHNRRHHAQPTACKLCGPQLSHSLQTIAQAISHGKIVALKGLGGYQLLCDATNELAIQTLRQRKNRPGKPLALMVLNTISAASLVHLNEPSKTLLNSKARPIVLLKQRPNKLPPSVAPGLSNLGIMLPSTPLHYLLEHALLGCPKGCDWLTEFQPTVLVVTSANLGGHPILIDDEAAAIELATVADLIVSYNRDIVTRMDDSVLRIINQTPTFIRRARGFVPTRIQLAHAIPSTLALGAELKQTFCITRGDEAFVSQHIGSLTNKNTIDFLHESLAHWTQLLDITIEQMACDAHPDFYTTQLAHDYNLPVLSVPHHHAHLASVAAEHQITQPALGLALDGYGYGDDGGAWGGELLWLQNNQCRRLGSLLPLPLPSGDRTAREPWRMGASILHELGRNDAIAARFAQHPQAMNLANLLKSSSTTLPKTSSCGRLFDAASALLNVCQLSQYEGHAAELLEQLVTKVQVLPNGWTVQHNQFNMLPTFEHLLDIPAVEGANLFHGTLIAGLAEWIRFNAHKMATNIVLLSGGCFLNSVLAEGLTRELTRSGVTVYLPKLLPPNDGGLSLGQAWIAGNQRMTPCA